VRATVRKWGNSLAIRVPTALVDELGFQEGGEVHLSSRNGTLVVSPVGRWTLDALVAGITQAHEVIGWGAPEGRESW
jgi:antitoxin MazE